MFGSVLLCVLLTISMLPCQGRKKLVYLTFDDGPEAGTKEVLDILHKHGVRATFFILGKELEKKEIAELLVRTVKEGHLIADHSFNHMGHNSPDGSPNNAYQNPSVDISYFGEKNIEPVRGALKAAGISEDDIKEVETSMKNFKRLPYTNNWRVGHLTQNCLRCTVPESSARNGILLADALLAAGSSVIGWDVGWATNYANNTYNEDAASVLAKVANTTGLLPDNIVILTHDRLQSTVSGAAELSQLVTEGLKAGHTFSTLDQYMDNYRKYIQQGQEEKGKGDEREKEEREKTPRKFWSKLSPKPL